MNVRRAMIDDAAAIAGLYRQSARYHTALDPDFYRVPDLATVVDRYAEVLEDGEDDAQVVLVAEMDGAVVGMVEVHLGPLPAPHSMVALQRPATMAMVIDDEHRRRSIGSGLIEHAEQWARDNGADVILLDVLASNENARVFYDRRGYNQHGLLLLKRGN